MYNDYDHESSKQNQNNQQSREPLPSIPIDAEHENNPVFDQLKEAIVTITHLESSDSHRAPVCGTLSCSTDVLIVRYLIVL